MSITATTGTKSKALKFLSISVLLYYQRCNILKILDPLLIRQPQDPIINPTTTPPVITTLNVGGISCVRFNNDEIAFLNRENEVLMYHIDNDTLILTDSFKLEHNYAQSITIDHQKRWLIYENIIFEPQLHYKNEIEKIIMRNLVDNSERVLFERNKYSE